MTFQLLKVGTDTEFFLRDIKTNLPVTAIGKFGGTKQEPITVMNTPGFCIQEDNVMPEINIPACETANDFVKCTQQILGWLQNEAKGKGLMVDISPSMSFTPEQLDHPQAKHIGCEPDYCVWTRSENEFDESKRHLLKHLRSAGGHVHISFNNTRKKITDQDKELLVMFCDLLMGIPSVILDSDSERKKLYGKAGSFRFKDYGIEYRTLSNFWFRNKKLMDWIFRSSHLAVDYMNDKNSIRKLYDEGAMIQEAINTQNINVAHHIMGGWGMNLPQY